MTTYPECDWENKMAAYLQAFCSERNNAQKYKTIIENFPYEVHQCTIYNALRRLIIKFPDEFKKELIPHAKAVFWAETECDNEEENDDDDSPTESLAA